MKLEDISAELRPRTPWESVDLGFALVRRDFRRIMAAWCLTVVPLWIGLLISCFWVPVGWVLLAIWWLKPIYDRVPLLILSRSLFGVTPKVSEVLRAWPGLLVRNFFQLMFSRFAWFLLRPSFAFNRSLLLPIIDLERQTGNGYHARAKVLLRQGGGTPQNLTVFCSLFETISSISLLLLGGMMVMDAQSLSEAFREVWENGFRTTSQVNWGIIGAIATYLVSLTLVEIFYVGGGFGLYLNCRTILEGWDVEIGFRRLARRLSKTTTVTAAILLGALLIGSPVRAAEEKNVPAVAPALEATGPKSEEAQAVERIKQHRDFKIHTRTEVIREETASPTPASKPAAPSKPSPTLDLNFGVASQILGYAVLAGGLAVLGVYLYRNRHWFVLRKGAATVKPQAPRTVMGLEITPESLPMDLLSVARRQWQAGDARGALSMLYRGALAWLVHTGQVPIQESDTEADCLRLARRLAATGPQDYFGVLTREWVRVAYGRREPMPPVMEQLFTQWPFALAGQSAAGRRGT